MIDTQLLNVNDQQQSRYYSLLEAQAIPAL